MLSLHNPVRNIIAESIHKYGGGVTDAAKKRVLSRAVTTCTLRMSAANNMHYFS